MRCDTSPRMQQRTRHVELLWSMPSTVRHHGSSVRSAGHRRHTCVVGRMRMSGCRWAGSPPWRCATVSCSEPQAVPRALPLIVYLRSPVQDHRPQSMVMRSTRALGWCGVRERWVDVNWIRQKPRVHEREPKQNTHTQPESGAGLPGIRALEDVVRKLRWCRRRAGDHGKDGRRLVLAAQ